MYRLTSVANKRIQFTFGSIQTMLTILSELEEEYGEFRIERQVTEYKELGPGDVEFINKWKEAFNEGN